MKPEEVAQLNEQIAAMAKAGLPLDAGLECLARDMSRGKLRTVTRALADDLRGGATLPEALAAHEKELPPFYAGLVEAGIRIGRLPQVLQTLTTYARSISLTRWIIIESLLYPATILFMALVLFGTVGFFLLPMMAQSLEDFRMPVPLATQIMLSIGRYLPALVGVPVVTAIVLFVLVRWYARRSLGGRQWWTRTLYSIPLLGSLIRSARLAAYTQLLAIMVENEVPMHEAVLRAGRASSDPLLEAQSQVISEQLAQGRPLGVVLRGKGMLPEWVAWMTLAGERQGTLAATLHQVAENYRRQVEGRSAVLRNILPPVFVLLTAGVLAFGFFVTFALPLIKMLEGLSK